MFRNAESALQLKLIWPSSCVDLNLVGLQMSANTFEMWSAILSDPGGESMLMTFPVLYILKQPAAHVPPRSSVQRTSQNLIPLANRIRCYRSALHWHGWTSRLHRWADQIGPVSMNVLFNSCTESTQQISNKTRLGGNAAAEIWALLGDSSCNTAHFNSLEMFASQGTRLVSKLTSSFNILFWWKYSIDAH